MLRFRGLVITFCLTACLCAPAAHAQLGLETIATGLTRPVFLTAPPGDDRLFVVEQAGRILVVKDGTVLATPFLDIRGNVDSSRNEEGLLGLAFHPNYATNGLFYVNYTHSTSVTRVSRFSVLGSPSTSDVADTASESIMISFSQPQNNHNGGMLAFGPKDGYLYISTGDGGGRDDQHGADGNGQSTDTLLGKILRIDVDAASPFIPSGNPFTDDPASRDEIWAYGLRNPWRFSFDRQTGDLFIGDVGQDAVEEIDFQPFDSAGGENYGWRIFEANRCNDSISQVTSTDCDALAPSAVFPIHEYANPTTGHSICGGYVYRGPAIPSLQGTYFFADSILTHVWSFRYDGVSKSEFQERTTELDPGGTLLSAMSSFGEDGAGELYIVTLFPGAVYKITGPGGEGEGEGEGEAEPFITEGTPVTGLIGLGLSAGTMALVGIYILRKK